MTSISPALATQGAMATFVLLWGSAAIFSRWGLDHGSPMALLIWRFVLALLALTLLAAWRRAPLLPPKGQRLPVLAVGAVLIGGYSISYFQALAHGITPGLLATLLGAQPILTLLLTERRFSAMRLCGLLLAVAGLALVVGGSLLQARLSWLGMGFAGAALVCITVGSLWQKRLALPPSQVMPLQYLVTLLMCAALLPIEPFRFEASWGFWLPTLWLALVISVAAQLLLYRLIRSGNLVNITSLLYLVPVVTVLLDWAVLGNALSVLGWLGMAGVIAGIALVFRTG